MNIICSTIFPNETTDEHTQVSRGPDLCRDGVLQSSSKRLLTDTREIYEKKYDVYHYIGIALDEDKRLQRKEALEPHKLYPLVEWGMTEADCLQYCYDHGYDWEGLYDIFKRVSCWCCPLQQIGELRKLRKHFPDLWEQLKDMDNRTWRTFKPNYSVEDLEVRFQLEEEFEAKGMTANPYNKLFRETLKERLGRSK